MDDQFIILEKFRNFFGFRTPFWKVDYASSGQKALEIMDQNLPEVIVVDSNMPEMNGNELLQRVKERYPSVFRVMLSSDCNATNVEESLGIVHQRLSKPVDMEELMDTLEMSRSLYQQIRDARVQQILAEFEGLPIPRESYFTITQLLKDPNVNIEEITEVIRKDSIISAHILKLVNSAMLGRAKRIHSISQAVMTLGIHTVQSLVLIVGLLAEKRKHKNSVINVDAFSHHSLEVANRSKLIAKAMGMSLNEQESAFTAGLLQNMGKFILADLYREKYQDYGIHEDPYASFMHFEGTGENTFTHPIIGAGLLAVWGIPGTIINAVAYHHRPSALKDTQMGITIPVHIAEGIVNYQYRKEAGTDLFDSGIIETQLIQKLGLKKMVEEQL